MNADQRTFRKVIKRRRIREAHMAATQVSHIGKQVFRQRRDVYARNNRTGVDPRVLEQEFYNSIGRASWLTRLKRVFRIIYKEIRGMFQKVFV